MPTREVVIGTYRPSPGVRAEDLEIPGPGLYEADFEVPGWLLPDFSSDRRFVFRVSGSPVRHIRSRVTGNVLTTRFEVLEPASAGTPETQFLVAFTFANVLRGIAVVIFGTLAAKILQGIVEALREVRRIVETPGGFGIGIGLGTLAVAGGLVWLGIRKG